MKLLARFIISNQSFLCKRILKCNFQGTAPIAGLMETSSDSDDSEHGNNDLADLSRVERLFFTGVLDELKISISYSSQVRMVWFLDIL